MITFLHETALPLQSRISYPDGIDRAFKEVIPYRYEISSIMSLQDRLAADYTALESG